MSEPALAGRASQVLAERFGHRAFQPPQREVIEHLTAGGDALVILPTGGGKSLCYQLPALLAPEGAVTVVLSPLIALMQDQVDQLRAKGIAATFINSSLSRDEREARLRAVLAGSVRLLYVTPERFQKPEFAAALAGIRVAFLAIDEAHCVSQWGHDFRPEYGRVGRIRELLGRPPTIALTATATRETQADIRARAGIENARLFHGGVERKNLFLSVRAVADREERGARLLEVVRRAGGPGIVYTALISELRTLHELLHRAGIRPLVYHGELGGAERRRTQRAFLESRDAVIVATNAFGMGVDKPDIRFIAHAQIPGSIEAYYQEIGRAGRDGGPSLCELTYLEEDLLIQKQFVEWANPDGRFLRGLVDVLARWGDTALARDREDLGAELLLKNRRDGRVDTALGLLRVAGVLSGSFEKQNVRLLRDLRPGEEDALVDPEKRVRDLRRLLQMVEYGRGSGCRKGAIHGYFGFPEPSGANCGSCDACAPAEARLAELERERPERRAAPAAAAAAEPEPPVRRGDWILVDERHAVAVIDVRRARGRWVAQGQSAGDLKIRSYDLEAVRWRPIVGEIS